MSPQLRVAGPGDLDLVAALEAEVFSEDPWTSFMIAEELSSPASRYWLAMDGSGDVIGYGGAKVGGDQADVMTIGVRAHARGAGLVGPGHKRVKDGGPDAGTPRVGA